MESISEILTLNLKRLREKSGLSQADVAKKIGVSPTQIFRIENGDSWPRLATLEAIAKVFDVHPLDFFTSTAKAERDEVLADILNDSKIQKFDVSYLQTLKRLRLEAPEIVALALSILFVRSDLVDKETAAKLEVLLKALQKNTP